ncbi:hypothetical protein ACFYWU_41345 [Streptomyces chrestomyceticus]|uniref:hypothetical protein n=1 Tax=Streptomyces chrestomyceticus TaxID=68185 RepID=UPI00369FA4CB
MSNRTTVIMLACAVTVLVAVLIGGAAGYLARRDHATYCAAVTRAAFAFAAALTLAATAASALADALF